MIRELNNKDAMHPQIVTVLRHCFTLEDHYIKSLVCDKTTSTTALTLLGVLRYIGLHRPSRLLLENVKCFLRIAGEVQAILAKKGYVSTWIENLSIAAWVACLKTQSLLRRQARPNHGVAGTRRQPLRHAFREARQVPHRTLGIDVDDQHQELFVGHGR